MYSIIYSSIAVKAFSAEELDELLFTFRFANKDKGVTGALLYGGGVRIMKAIEGPEKTIKTLFANIQNDTRHHSVKVLSENRIYQRNFEQWTMHYKEYDPELSSINEVGFSFASMFGDSPVLDFDPTIELAEVFRKQFD